MGLSMERIKNEDSEHKMSVSVCLSRFKGFAGLDFGKLFLTKMLRNKNALEIRVLWGCVRVKKWGARRFGSATPS